MNIKVTPVNFNASQDLIEHVRETFTSLGKYNDQIISADLFLESINDDKADKLVKIKVLVPGNEIFMQHHEGDFVSASQILYDKVKHHLASQKEQDKDNQQYRPDKVY